MEYDISKLDGALLDAAVALAEGINYDFNALPRAVFVHEGSHSMIYNPSENWSLAGPIIERERMTIIGATEPRPWQAHAVYTWALAPERLATEWGPTPLVAAMRAYVTGKVGGIIEIT